MMMLDGAGDSFEYGDGIGGGWGDGNGNNGDSRDRYMHLGCGNDYGDQDGNGYGSNSSITYNRESICCTRTVNGDLRFFICQQVMVGL